MSIEAVADQQDGMVTSASAVTAEHTAPVVGQRVVEVDGHRERAVLLQMLSQHLIFAVRLDRMPVVDSHQDRKSVV